ncbi:MAG: hypothetical protein ACYCVZ_00745 [Streptosporangiaceae bacterium]
MTDDADHYQAMRRYVTELKQLLDDPGLTPDTRARCLASLIDADTFTETADTLRRAAAEMTGDAAPLFTSAVRMFGDKAGALARALEGFREPAEDLAAQLRRMDGYR